MRLITVYSDRFVTETNKNGKKEIDLDTPEGEEVMGGKEKCDAYKANLIIMEKSRDILRQQAIASLKVKGELPESFKGR